MPIIYNLNGVFGPNTNIAAFIAAAQIPPPPALGPMPGHFPVGGGPVNNLGPNMTALSMISPVPQQTIVIGLITCAAVFYMSTDPDAVAAVWVHHANAGRVTAADVVAARAGLGNPPWASICVVFAHPGPSDNGYSDSMNTMISQGIPTNSIIEIPNMVIPQIGVNNLGQLGF
jgi:hypothetical protein